MSGFGLVVGIAASAWAGDTASCGLVGMEKVDLSKVTAMAIRGVEANIEVLAADGLEIRQEGAVCNAGKGAPVTVRLTQKGTVLIATVDTAVEGAKLTFALPRGLEALTVDHQVGALEVRELPARIAVVSNTGSVEVYGAKSLRVAYGTGDVIADGVEADVQVDHVAGNLTVDDVAGSLATSDVSGTVVHNNVRGAVQAL